MLVLNQFGLPRSEDGITRHVDLFERVEGWDFRVIAGHLNHYSQKDIKTDDERFVLVRVPRYTGAGLARVLSWIVYVVKAVVAGVLLGRPNVIYASSPHLLTPIAGVALARIWRRPLVVEVRDLWPETLVGAGAVRRESQLHRALVALEAWIYRSADHVVGVTAGWEDHLAAFGVSREAFTVVPNGTELAAPTSSREDLRRRHGIDGVTAVYAGAHGPTNAIDAFIDVASALPDLRLLLIGAGSQKERLMRRARDEALDNVEFRDPVPKTELNDLLVACDIGVHTIGQLAVLQLGMSPNKVFDYMAAGLPVVSNAGAGLYHVIGGNTCALVGGPASLQQSLEKLLDEGPELRSYRGEAGRSLVSEYFSRRSAARIMKEVIESVG